MNDVDHRENILDIKEKAGKHDRTFGMATRKADFELTF